MIKSTKIIKLTAMNIGRAAMDIGLAPISKGEPDLSGEPGEVATPQAWHPPDEVPGKAGIQYVVGGVTLGVELQQGTEPG